MPQVLLFAFAGISAHCQTTYPLNGVHNKLHNYYAFTNAHLFVDFKTFIPEATLLVKDGKVVASGSTVSIPKGSAVFDLNGKYIYPSFIDLCSDYGMPPIPKKKPANRKHTPPQYERNIEGAYSWNQAIHPETRAATLFSVDKKTADTLRRAGFGTVLTHSPDGIARGSASLVTLGDGKAVEEMLLTDAASCYSFRKGSSTQNYPSSLMGSMALLRQTFYDAVWYKDYAEKDERNISLEAINRYRNLPQVFEADNYLDVLMADTLGREFGIQFIVKGGGDEYKRIDLISKTGAPLILPLNFPKPFDVSDPYDALEIPLAALKHWELAPANPAFAERAGIRFALTTKGLGNKADFLKNLRKAVQSGLSPDTALKVLTYYPASFIGMQDEIGTLKPTALANFFIASGDLFDEKTIIYENWVQGRRHIIHNINTADIRGVYDLNIHSHIYKIRIAGSFEKPVAKWMQKDSLKNKINIRREGKLISLSFEIQDQFFNGYLRLSGKVNYKSGIWDGKAVLPDGTWVSWNAIRQKEKHDALGKGDSPAPDTMLFHRVWYPCTDFGFEEIPKAEYLLLKNARVWTNVDTLGILEHADILIQNGKISAVGKGFALPQGVKVIKLNGKNLTPGIIDEHSHIAIRGGVNEGSQAVSSEVRIGDVINP
ncbi:MAG: amidohydrolase family protein, partial [Flavobacteriales bacterium]